MPAAEAIATVVFTLLLAFPGVAGEEARAAGTRADSVGSVKLLAPLHGETPEQANERLAPIEIEIDGLKRLRQSAKAYDLRSPSRSGPFLEFLSRVGYQVPDELAGEAPSLVAREMLLVVKVSHGNRLAWETLSVEEAKELVDERIRLLGFRAKESVAKARLRDEESRVLVEYMWLRLQPVRARMGEAAAAARIEIVSRKLRIIQFKRDQLTPSDIVFPEGWFETHIDSLEAEIEAWREKLLELEGVSPRGWR